MTPGQAGIKTIRAARPAHALGLRLRRNRTQTAIGMGASAARARYRVEKDSDQIERLAMAAVAAGLPARSPETDRELKACGKVIGTFCDTIRTKGAE